MKKAATLIMVVVKEDSEGNKRKSIRYFPVFSYQEFERVISTNKKKVA